MVGNCQQDGSVGGAGMAPVWALGMPDQGLWWCHFPCPHPTALPMGSRGEQPAESSSSRAGTAPRDSHAVAALQADFAEAELAW